MLLEEDKVVAGKVEAEFGDHVLSVFTVNLRLFLGVWDKVKDVAYEMAHSAGNTA